MKTCLGLSFSHIRLAMIYFLVVAGMVMVGCSGDTAGSGISGSGSPVLVAGGPISGFGGDPATGAGQGANGTESSMVINGEKFEIGQSDLSIDGESANAYEFQLGMQVVAESDSATDNGSQQALSISATTDVQGTVTAADNLNRSIRVLEQNIKITNETVTSDATAGTIALNVGDKVRVSGLRDASNNILASRLDLTNNSSGIVTGRISSYNAVSQSFSIGNLQVVFDSSIPVDQLQNGSLVQVKTSNSASAGTAVATSIRRLQSFMDQANGHKLKFQGRVDSTSTDSSGRLQISIMGINAIADNATIFSNGDISELTSDAWISVDGLMNDNFLVLNRVKFLYPATSTSNFVVSDISISQMEPVYTGTIISLNDSVIHVDEDTRFLDVSTLAIKHFNLGYIRSEDLLSINGYLDQDGRLVATFVIRTTTTDF